MFGSFCRFSLLQKCLPSRRELRRARGSLSTPSNSEAETKGDTVPRGRGMVESLRTASDEKVYPSVAEEF